MGTFKKRVYFRRYRVLKAGNAPVAPLVLHGVMDGGNHLPSGDPNARLQIKSILKDLYPKKAPGPNKIPYKVLKTCQFH